MLCRVVSPLLVPPTPKRVTAYLKCSRRWLQREQLMLRRRATLLRRLAVLQDLPACELMFMAQWLKERRYKRGTIMQSEGEAATHVTFVLTGAVGLYAWERGPYVWHAHPLRCSVHVREHADSFLHPLVVCERPDIPPEPPCVFTWSMWPPLPCMVRRVMSSAPHGRRRVQNTGTAASSLWDMLPLLA